jgi:hypothetical protein
MNTGQLERCNKKFTNVSRLHDKPVDNVASILHKAGIGIGAGSIGHVHVPPFFSDAGHGGHKLGKMCKMKLN